MALFGRGWAVLAIGSERPELTCDDMRDEAGRLAALARYQILDTPTEPQFDRITSLVRSVLEVPISVVSLLDQDRQWFKSCIGLNVRQTARDVAFCDRTIRADEPLVVGNAAEDERFKDNPLVTGEPGIRAYAGVPIRTPDGYNLGSLCAIDTKPRTFTPDQIEILKKFADLVMDEIELRQIASVDELTGFLTRRAWLEEAKKAIARAHRHGRPASIAIFDLDHFKSVNDRFGHPAGDKVLEAVSASCRETVREGDVLGRLGGEEFACLMPETAQADAMTVAERHRARIAQLSIAIDDPRTARLAITASFGVACLGPSVSTPEAWLTLADRALYEAKKAGRNRCILADPPRSPAPTP